MTEDPALDASPSYDLVCVGGGIVGLATALDLAQRSTARIVVLEAEDAIARHQTGRNSGVIHSGLYYQPGSRKARNCVAGRRRLIELCRQEGIAHEICGKLVIAADASETKRLDELERRGRANGLSGLERIPGERIPEREPHARGHAALWVPETGIVDFGEVARAFARRFQEAGGELRLGARVVGLRHGDREVAVETTAGAVRAGALINCAGLQSDRVARLAGVRPGLRIVPFRGEYFDLREDRRHLLRNLVYPVPDPRFPFLGVHLTRRVDGSVETGPNAVLALARHGYRRGEVSLRDAWDTLSYPGLWRLGLRFWRIALGELLRAGSPRRFARALGRFVPEIEPADLQPGGCGIRAQALDLQGRLLDDFEIAHGERTLHVLNAPSPGATASLAIGDDLASLAIERFGLRQRPAVAPG
ncbi:MAG TPA: L-2-hydroxyglutarate oxidase [Thermoanaerobaculia bacterium]|nr:L-2-hydroxyglutarate oxidase [Thermoanaerobaculia bacterium]